MAAFEDTTRPAGPASPCPICRKQRPQASGDGTLGQDGRGGQNRYHPFCSKRCADVDLGRWFSGDYAIPAVEPPDDWSEEF